jgi:hypothetical protein
MVNGLATHTEDDDFKLTDEVATWLRMSPEALRKWRRRGIGPPFVKLPTGPVRYRRRDVQAWIEANAR